MSLSVKVMADRKAMPVNRFSPDTMMAAFFIHILMRLVSLRPSFQGGGNAPLRLQ